MNVIKAWGQVPNKLGKHFFAVIPIILSQTFQRLYPMIDNRYVAMLGKDALYLHNLQYNFAALGQFIGLATYLSCLVFWRRADLQKSQGAILIKHVSMAGIFTLLLGLIAGLSTSTILNYYKIDQLSIHIAKTYFWIGLCNMVLLAIYGGLDGMLVGSGKQKFSMYIAGLMALGNLVLDRYVILYNTKLHHSVDSLYNAMKWIGLSTSLMLLSAIVFTFILIIRHIKGWSGFTFKDMYSVWWGEVATYLIRGSIPFVFAYQLCSIQTSARFLTTYQLALHLSYLFCFPLIAALQIAVRDACSNQVAPASEHTWPYPPSWWGVFLYTGMIPSSILIIMGALMPATLIKWIYGYSVPVDHVPFLLSYFIGCWLGQFGNAFSIPLRAAKKNYLVTKNFIIGELIVMVGGTQLLVYLNIATPMSLGLIMMLFTFAYTVANSVDAYLLRVKIKYLNTNVDSFARS